MSDWKHAYGWMGHILVSKDELDSNSHDNVCAVAPGIFAAICKAHSDGTIDERIGTRALGIEETGIMFLATGTGFSEGFQHYGTVFEAAELMADKTPNFIAYDENYLAAMKEIYGLDLPPCRPMVGVASEH